MPTKFGESVVMRIVDEQNAIFDLTKLGFRPPMLQTWQEVLQEANGVVLVTGPTGSGKSTTLYSSLLAVTNEKIKVCTVEDPIEHNLPGVNQFEISPKAGFTFPKALRSLLRQDPNVIMVGEVRDAETAKLATEAALTGHLVFTTLHTNDAVSAITRLTNMGVEPYLIAASVRCVLAQRLVRRLCPHCREPVGLTNAGRAILEHILGSKDVPEMTYVAHGCSACRGTGTAGRIGVYELLP